MGVNYWNGRHVGWPITRKICIISLLMDRRRSGQTDRRTNKWDVFIHSSPSLTPSSNLLLTLSTINHEVRLSYIRASIRVLARPSVHPGIHPTRPIIRPPYVSSLLTKQHSLDDIGRNDDCVESLANRESFARVIDVVIEMCICPWPIRL